MCGIVGYISSSKKIDIPTFVGMIKRLDYRGYDSWGVSFKTPTKDISTHHHVGKINPELAPHGEAQSIIGHTRWSTHGAPTKENSHPHVSNDGKITLVHNGIIENYSSLKEQLKGHGFTFYGQTDSEILPNLIQFHYEQTKDIHTAIKKTLQNIKGTYGITFIHQDYDTLFFARKDSPLLIGVGKNELFVSSDVTSFLDRTKKVIYLEDGDYGTLNGELEIFNAESGEKVHRDINTIEWDIERAKKGEFTHFMLKEISEQVYTIKQALMQEEESVRNIVEKCRNTNVYVVACGSSYNAAKAAEIEFLEQGCMMRIIQAHEFTHYVPFLNENSTLIAISQSGETIDLLNAVKCAKSKGASITSIVNVQGSTLARLSDEILYMNVGPEICVLSTKSYTAQVAMLFLIARSFDKSVTAAREEIAEIERNIYYLTSKHCTEETKELSQILRYSHHMYIIGRDRDVATAHEAALKIKEVSYIHAESFAGGEIKHGPIAMIEPGSPCIVFVPNKNPEEILSNAQELKSRGAFIIGICEEKHDVFDFQIKVRSTDTFGPILRIIPIQVLAYYLAVMKGLDPDKPRNLAKCVSVK
jgi:glutamine---fructose-6-phosphate transaminase (isomerizing)